MARDAYGIVPLQGEQSVNVVIQNPKASIVDPMEQIGFVSWKTMQTAVILNQAWLARIETAATAL